MRKIRTLLLILFVAIAFMACTPEEGDVTIVLNSGIDTVEVNTTFTDAGATAKAFGFKVDVEVIWNNVNIETVGTYQIIYEVDYKDIVKRITRVVHVVDTTPPTGTLNAGVDTIQEGTVWVDASVTAQDNSLLEVTIEKQGSVNANIPGEYIIQYILTDGSGNQTILERVVTVLSNE